jgi:hypothetical protein
MGFIPDTCYHVVARQLLLLLHLYLVPLLTTPLQ